MTNLCISFYDYDDLITVLLGPDEFQFQVHRSNICERSKFFEAAVSTDRWIEGQQNVVRLPEVGAADFQMYIHWVYTGKLSPDVFWSNTGLDPYREQRAYFAAYIIADFLNDSDLCTLALDTMITKSIDWHYMPNANTCQGVWEKTPKGSPLRAFIVEWKISAEAHEGFSDHVGDYPREFLEEMAVFFMSHQSHREPEREDPEVVADRMRGKLLPERSQIGSEE
jgi:hypothetical protein